MLLLWLPLLVVVPAARAFSLRAAAACVRAAKPPELMSPPPRAYGRIRPYGIRERQWEALQWKIECARHRSVHLVRHLEMTSRIDLVFVVK